jgi:hypothetical protein
MNDGLQYTELTGIPENPSAQQSAIDRPLGSEDIRTKAPPQLGLDSAVVEHSMTHPIHVYF